MSEDNLIKIHLDLPRNEEVGGESFWAENLGNDLYRMRNTPFHAYGINFYDIVYAIAQSEDLKPSILKVHELGGHKTLRVFFLDKATAEERIERLAGLNQYKGYHENADGTLFAIDVEPDGDYGKVCDVLYKWENDGILSYETCEAREGFGFDAE
jgi:hypothetical protein